MNAKVWEKWIILKKKKLSDCGFIQIWCSLVQVTEPGALNKITNFNISASSKAPGYRNLLIFPSRSPLPVLFVITTAKAFNMEEMKAVAFVHKSSSLLLLSN